MELANVRVVAEGLGFPEGPVAMADGSVILVEIMGGRITRVAPDGRKETVAEVGGGPNGAAIGPDGALYVCNNGWGGGVPSIQRVEIDTGRTDTVYLDCDGRGLVSPNDLVFDETGCFWFTDHGGDAVYYASPDGLRIERAVSGVRDPNGVGLSPDGRTLYWAQTYTRQVMLRRLEAPGRVIQSPPYTVGSFARRLEPDRSTLLAGLPGAQELDSLAVDSSGAVCVGTLCESGITVVSADGASVERLTLPPALADPAVTNICFGGEGLRTAYLTCSVTGRLVACDWPRPGLKLAFNA
jgi:gluconolactonase